MSRRLGVLVIGIVVVAAALVLVGNIAVAHTNPPVERTTAWDSPQTEALARAACLDCHSNETVWPWYSYVAPVSFLVAHDVEEGREKLNISTGRGELEGREMAEQIERGTMPPRIYTLMHPDANLSEEQQTQLIQGLMATFGRGD